MGNGVDDTSTFCRTVEFILDLLSQEGVQEVEIRNAQSDCRSFPASSRFLEDCLSRAEGLRKLVLHDFDLDSMQCAALGNFCCVGGRRDMELSLAATCRLMNPSALVEGIRKRRGPTALSLHVVNCHHLDKQQRWARLQCILSILGESNIPSFRICGRPSLAVLWRLGQDRRRALFTALARNRTLETLDLKWLQIDQITFTELWALVVSHPSLRHINLCLDRKAKLWVQNDLLTVIESALWTNPRIESLQILGKYTYDDSNSVCKLAVSEGIKACLLRNKHMNRIRSMSRETVTARKMYLSMALPIILNNPVSVLYLWINKNVDLVLEGRGVVGKN